MQRREFLAYLEIAGEGVKRVREGIADLLERERGGDDWVDLQRQIGHLKKLLGEIEGDLTGGERV